MAIGLGRMMGLRFMENFRAPYLSASITEFWRRWHISLSSWLRDYLYISLGGNRRGRARTLVNLFLVMVIGGLWHGAALTFVVWGAWHGALLLVERLRGERHLTQRLPRPLAVAFTMLLVCIGWVFFRASSVAGAGAMFAGMMGLHGVGLSAELRWQVGGLSIVALAVAWVATFMGPWLAKSAEGSESAGYRGGGAAGGWRRALSGLQVAAVPLFVIAMVKVLAESSPIFLYGKF
jgi:alginate O-acetyltransferase complex protein AlgI